MNNSIAAVVTSEMYIYIHKAPPLNRVWYCFDAVGFQLIQKLLSESYDRCWIPNAGALPSLQWSFRILMLLYSHMNGMREPAKANLSPLSIAFYPSVKFFQGYCLILSAAKTISILRCCNLSSTTLLSPNRQHNPVVMECIWTKHVCQEIPALHMCEVPFRMHVILYSTMTYWARSRVH